MIDILLKLICGFALAVVFIHTPRMVRMVQDEHFLARTVKEHELWPSLRRNKCPYYPKVSKET
jgi:hypothetical protein